MIQGDRKYLGLTFDNKSSTVYLEDSAPDALLTFAPLKAEDDPGSVRMAMQNQRIHQRHVSN